MVKINYQHMSSMSEALRHLSTKIEEVFTLKQSPDSLEELQKFYRTELLPHLISLRKINRDEKDNLELRYKKLKDLNQRLISLQDSYDGVHYEARCLEADIASIKPKDQIMPNDGHSSNGVQNGKLDQDERMKMLEEEEQRRKDLQSKLEKCIEETKMLEANWTVQADKFNKVKPYMKSLIDNADSLTDSTQET